jgi:flagellar motility protein MotE (MotC chaperone)
MIRSLLKLLFMLVLGVLVYNYFLGTPEEKEASKAIFREVKELAVGVKDLVKSEKEKFDAGKYDEAVDKIGGLLSKLKRKAKDIDEKYIDQIQSLEKRKKELKDAISEFNHEDGRLDTSEKDSMVSELDRLLKDSERLMQDMERKDNEQ